MLLLALAAMSLFALSGCSSDDGVTPDENPEFTAEDAAHQAGLVTMAMAQLMQGMTNKSDPVIVEVSMDHVYGAYWDDGDNDRVWTDTANKLYVDINGLPHDLMVDTPVTFDITDTDGVANGFGSLDFVTFDVTFVIASVTLDPGNFPIGGQIIVDTSGWSAAVEFLAGHTATVTITGAGTWEVNMDTGELTEI
jgi:hypothetical protein